MWRITMDNDSHVQHTALTLKYSIIPLQRHWGMSLVKCSIWAMLRFNDHSFQVPVRFSHFLGKKLSLQILIISFCCQQKKQWISAYKLMNELRNARSFVSMFQIIECAFSSLQICATAYNDYYNFSEVLFQVCFQTFVPFYTRFGAIRPKNRRPGNSNVNHTNWRVHGRQMALFCSAWIHCRHLRAIITSYHILRAILSFCVLWILRWHFSVQNDKPWIHRQKKIYVLVAYILHLTDSCPFS